ncbi:hypothetical protein Acsp03_62700 [Actinomadura sp. NBRC 104412]|nr:hypothetical protein Acsp03_62700 [Actinomadura sp. NBRC 104412]
MPGRSSSGHETLRSGIGCGALDRVAVGQRDIDLRIAGAARGSVQGVSSLVGVLYLGLSEVRNQKTKKTNCTETALASGGDPSAQALIGRRWRELEPLPPSPADW